MSSLLLKTLNVKGTYLTPHASICAPKLVGIDLTSLFFIDTFWLSVHGTKDWLRVFLTYLYLQRLTRSYVIFDYLYKASSHCNSNTNGGYIFKKKFEGKFKSKKPLIYIWLCMCHPSRYKLTILRKHVWDGMCLLSSWRPSTWVVLTSPYMAVGLHLKLVGIYLMSFFLTDTL